MECRVCFAPWAIPKNCWRLVAEVFGIWLSKDSYGRSLWILIRLIKKKIGDNLRRWPKVLFEDLWAYCIFGMVLGVENHATKLIRGNKFGKRSPSWEGPYSVIKVIFGNSYLLEVLQGGSHPRAFNGRCLEGTFQVFGKKPRVLSKQWPIHVSPLEQIWPMNTSPLDTR